jgi:hypothetical protein
MLSKRALFFRESLLTLIVLIFVVGSLVLAIIDASYRLAFADLAKVAVCRFPRLDDAT